MQGTGSAKSFLEKLKSGRTTSAAIDNNAPPDGDGVILRRVERQYASEPLSALGLKLTEDAEVLSTEVGSPAAKSNIPLHYMIIAVNNQFVGSRADFEDIAAQLLTLVIKLQSTAAMSELLANILNEEEKNFNENGDSCIDVNELLRTTPRYGFLSAEHPMFLRWNQRLQTQREARQLIRQATREAEEQQAKEALEALRRVADAEDEIQQQQAQQERQHQQIIRQGPETVNPSAPEAGARPGGEVLLKQVQDESTFGESNLNNEGFEESPEEASPEELLKLIGAEPVETEVVQHVDADEPTEVRFFINPTEEYALSNGTRVTISVKKRSGPIPKPPPGKPPKGIEKLMTNKLSDAIPATGNGGHEPTCTFCYVSGHTEKDCSEKREQERKLSVVPKERQICRDFMRGRCTRSECVMRHVSLPPRGRRARSRSRERSVRRRSREKHRRTSRERRRGSRRRSRRRDPSVRSHRRK
ncbi:MRB1-associated protein [Trypanosoma brucei equiperdum]|uniref:MRB1-associated protein n=1 Tax=Trypanosoma brucei equiperdum TaxID=630700 RepID=A0A3L6KY08_9TRYP|nr:MRB1-associated protein [Trypanosoma brucei equiperdum]